MVHKFALQSTDAHYRGSALLDGVLGDRNNLDFRLSEFNNDLRVVTSRYDYSDNPWDEADLVDHQLTILRESNDRIALETVSTLPNEAHPEEIGKPNELLYGVRFAGERAYLVTFERVDPLYVLDLSDPAQPVIAGELEVPGFSDFIHPVSDDLLVTLGKDVTPSENGQWLFFDGVKVELYNVSDISAPQSIISVSIGDRNTNSEALHDRHAFTYAAVNESTHRFAIPIGVYLERSDYSIWNNSGLHLFEIRNVDNPASATIVQQGEIQTHNVDNSEQWLAYSKRRSVFHDDAVYLIDTVEGIWSTLWSSPDSVLGPVTGNNTANP